MYGPTTEDLRKFSDWLEGRKSRGFEKVTRITLVSTGGVEFEKYNLYEHGVELHLQDDGRTLKIFPRKESE